jgi:hypothetical protein
MLNVMLRLTAAEFLDIFFNIREHVHKQPPFVETQGDIISHSMNVFSIS